MFSCCCANLNRTKSKKKKKKKKEMVIPMARDDLLQINSNNLELVLTGLYELVTSMRAKYFFSKKLSQ